MQIIIFSCQLKLVKQNSDFLKFHLLSCFSLLSTVKIRSHWMINPLLEDLMCWIWAAKGSQSKIDKGRGGPLFSQLATVPERETHFSLTAARVAVDSILAWARLGWNFTFDQDKVFNFKNFDQLAEVGLKKITEQRSRALVLTSYFYSFALERTFWKRVMDKVVGAAE